MLGPRFLSFLFGASLLVGCASNPPQEGAADDGGAIDLVTAGAPDGQATRQACTGSFGHAITSAYGRLDGTLVSIVPPGHHGCNGDTDHLHLQVQASGATYDIAITVADLNGGEVDYLALDHAPPGAPWSEGWHADAALDYPTAFGVHAGDFAAMPKSALTTAVDNELSNASQVSVFATGYTDGTGAHKVHRNGGNTDGALVLGPRSAAARVLLFHFATQSF